MDWFVRKLPVPPAPPPAWPDAPLSGWLVVSSVPTPSFLEPETDSVPAIVTVPEARMVQGLGPWTISSAPSGMTRLRTSMTPLMTDWLVSGSPPSPPTIVSAVESRMTVTPGSRCQSKSPPGPPVPPNSNEALSSPEPHTAYGVPKAASVSSKEPSASPERVKPSRNSSPSEAAGSIPPPAGGSCGTGFAAIVVSITAKFELSRMVLSSVRSAKPWRMLTRSGASWGRMPCGVSRSTAPVSVQLASSSTSVPTFSQLPPAASYSIPSFSSLMLSADVPTGWSMWTTIETCEDWRLYRFSGTCAPSRNSSGSSVAVCVAGSQTKYARCESSPPTST